MAIVLELIIKERLKRGFIWSKHNILMYGQTHVQSNPFMFNAHVLIIIT